MNERACRRGRWRSGRTLAAGVSALALLAACGSGSTSDSDVVKLGYIASLSGPGGIFAEQGLQSMKLAVEQVNAAGGVEIEVVVADDASDPKTSGEVCQRLVAKDNVDAILGVQNSANRAACLPIAEGASGTPYLYATPYESGECRDNFFVAGEVPNQQITPLVEHLLGQGAAKTFYFMGSDYAAPRGTNDFARKDVDAGGAAVLGEEYAPLGTTDFAPLIAKALTSKADVVFVTFIGSDYVSFLKQWRDTAGTQDVTLASPIPPFGAGDVAEGILAAFSYFPSLDTDANRTYRADLEKKFGSKAETPSILSVQTYNSVQLLAAALERAGSAEKSAVVEALHEVTFEGPGGEVGYNQEGHMALPMYVAKLGGDPMSGEELIVESFPPVEPDANCGG